MCFKKELCIFTTGLTGHFLSYSGSNVPQKSTWQFKLQPVLPVNLPAVLDATSRYFREQNRTWLSGDVCSATARNMPNRCHTEPVEPTLKTGICSGLHFAHCWTSGIPQQQVITAVTQQVSTMNTSYRRLHWSATVSHCLPAGSRFISSHEPHGEEQLVLNVFLF